LQVSITVFFITGAVEKFFAQRWISPPPAEKVGPYAYVGLPRSSERNRNAVS